MLVFCSQKSTNMFLPGAHVTLVFSEKIWSLEVLLRHSDIYWTLQTTMKFNSTCNRTTYQIHKVEVYACLYGGSCGRLGQFFLCRLTRTTIFRVHSRNRESEECEDQDCCKQNHKTRPWKHRHKAHRGPESFGGAFCWEALLVRPPVAAFCCEDLLAKPPVAAFCWGDLRGSTAKVAIFCRSCAERRELIVLEDLPDPTCLKFSNSTRWGSYTAKTSCPSIFTLEWLWLGEQGVGWVQNDEFLGNELDFWKQEFVLLWSGIFVFL